MEVSGVGERRWGLAKGYTIHPLPQVSISNIFFFFFFFHFLRDACPKGWIKLHSDRQGFHGTHPFCCCTPYWFSGPRLHWLLNDSSI